MTDAVLTVGSILVEHEWVTGLGLGLEDGIPELLSLDGLVRSALSLVLEEELVELFAVELVKSGSIRRAEQGPVAVLFDSAHKHVWYPEGVEEITSADLLLAVVLSKVEELKDVGVPRLDVDGECAWSLVATLVNVSRGVVEHAEHREDTIRVALRMNKTSQHDSTY